MRASNIKAVNENMAAQTDPGPNAAPAPAALGQAEQVTKLTQELLAAKGRIAELEAIAQALETTVRVQSKMIPLTVQGPR